MAGPAQPSPAQLGKQTMERGQQQQPIVHDVFGVACRPRDSTSRRPQKSSTRGHETAPLPGARLRPAWQAPPRQTPRCPARVAPEAGCGPPPACRAEHGWRCSDSRQATAYVTFQVGRGVRYRNGDGAQETGVEGNASARGAVQNMSKYEQNTSIHGQDVLKYGGKAEYLRHCKANATLLI